MADSEINLAMNERNDRLMSEFAVTRRQSRSLFRNWAAISKKSLANSFQSQANVFSKISSCSIGNDCVDYNNESSSTLIEDRADEIVRRIEQTHSLMDDNPKSNNDRIETLREMTEYLTLKRSVKKKLTKSISSANKTLDFSKRLKYSISIFFFKIPVAIKHFLSSFELWYSSLKVIEGHFGSNVASYFKFLRKLFLLNACIFILMLFFIMIPQLLFRLFQYVDDNHNANMNVTINSKINDTSLFLNFLNEKVEQAPLVVVKANPYEENGEFRLGNVFTGEGFLTNTILFYGYYTNTSLQLIKNHSYNIPAAYFFTSAVCYLIIFFFLFTSVAVSYRKCYIETSGGMHNTFSNKVFCGWDFGIATKQAAELKSKSIYIEIKELLDDVSKPTKKKTCINTFYTTVISLSLNGLLLFLLGLGGMYSWKYLDQQMTKADTATTMMMWLILTLVIAIAPVLFSFIAHFEGFESPSTALYMTLIRTFTLYAVVIAVVVAYRLNRSTEFECWETILGQDMFRLVVLDFIFGSIGIALSEFIRYRIYVKMWSGIGCPEFDIARSTMNLIYNQTLFYVGLFFSPVSSLLITVKLFIIFYVKKWGAVYNCKPFVKPWKASQAHTVYLSIAFFAFFSVVIAYGYIITSVKTSNCGPFRGEKFMYERLLEEILSNQDSSILMVFYYITRPGVVGIVLMAMVLGVYYMRAVALARIHVVKHLRYLLRLKAEDRKLLLNEISKYTKSRDSKDDPDPDPNHFLVSRSHNYRFLNSKENSPIAEKTQEKFLKSENLKRAKFAFSSMKDLPCDKEKKKIGLNKSNRNSHFNSIPNISNLRTQDNVELVYLFNQKQQNEISEENFCEARDAFISDFEPSLKGGSLKSCSENGSSKKSPKHKLVNALNENRCRDFGVGQTPLNFNPVFTESVPIHSDDEQDYVDITTDVIERTRKSDKNLKSLSEPRKIFLEPSNSFKKYSLEEEERIPSRITFSDNEGKSAAKKHH